MNENTDTSRKSRAGGRRASNIKERIKQDGKEKIESGKRAAADQIAEIADAIDVAGSQLDQSQPTLANYAAKIADSVGGLASRLREDSIEDLYHDVRQVASRHPGMFLLGSAALGLVLARFMKASGEQLETAGGGGEDIGSPEYGEEEGSDVGAAGNEPGTLYGEGSRDEQNDADSLQRSRGVPDPYGSPNLGA